MAYRFGTRANDTLTGTSGDDFFWGNDGNDTMYGGAGNDLFVGGRGSDAYFGGTGSDTVNYSGTTQASQPFFGFDGVVVNLTDGIGGELSDPNSTDTYSSIENVTGSNFNDVLFGDGNANVLRGLDGHDWIEGRGGADTLEGGGGIDTLAYNESTARVIVDIQNNTASGGHATGDVISGFENIDGSDFNDILSGNGGDNWIRGGEGNDTINGRGGNDTIQGAAGNDTLTGGSGFDTFQYYSNTTYNGVDHIRDFNVDQDRITYNGSSVEYSYAFDISTLSFDVTIQLDNGTIILDDIAIYDLSDALSAVELV